MATTALPSSSSEQSQTFLEWKWGAKLKRRQIVLVAVALVLLTVFTAWRCDIDTHSIATGIQKGVPLIGMYFPPAWSAIGDMWQPIAVTTVTALITTILGICLSLPCALAAASNIAPTPIRLPMRVLIGLERGMPEIVQMLLMVAVFGLGMVPGIIALSFSSIGMLAKLLADAIEELEPSTLEAVAGTGATKSQVIRYAVIPQILPSLLANGLFRFEVNVRAGVILGAVGAGGIGYVLSTAMGAMEYPRACLAALLTLALVIVAERLSDFLRERILSGGQHS
jgi:phosphonate transport system permease protein